MRSLWMGIVPGPQSTRVLVQDGPGRVLLKARLPGAPSHPRAIPVLCEALALWCGRPVRAAVGVDGLDGSSESSRWLDAIDAVTRTPLFEIQVVPRVRPPQNGRDIEGLGDFRDVRQLVLFEVAR